MAEIREQDQWARWLLKDRFGATDEQRRGTLQFLAKIRDRVLDGADLTADSVVLDLGCGDGLLGFGALERIGPDGKVIFCDISDDLLEETRRIATAADLLDRCDFRNAGFPELAGIADSSADAAVIRSVLIYVADKATALANVHRILRPGGRLSLFEPISSFAAARPGRLWGFDSSRIEGLAKRVREVHDRHTEPNTLLGFDERDLFELVETAGFTEISMTYEAQSGMADPDADPDLDAFLSIVPNPTMPSLAAILAEALNPAGQKRIRQHFRAELIAGRHEQRSALCYLNARRAAAH